MKKCFFALLTLGGTLLASPPTWWSDPQTGILNSNPPNNAGPLAGAQLKNTAQKAALYFDLMLPAPGAGPAIKQSQP